MNIVITGFRENGKDTACKILGSPPYCLSSISSSWFACKTFLFEQLKEEYGYSSMEECYDDRMSPAMRKVWYEAIKAYNTPDGSRLGRGIFQEHPIYNGLRSIDEYHALKAADMIDLFIWIDAEERVGVESSDSMTLHKGLADVVVDNNGGLLELRHQLDKIYHRVILPRL